MLLLLLAPQILMFVLQLLLLLSLLVLKLMM
jgi:hypothetical protein